MTKKINKIWKDVTGVSPIIAVIMTVAITVVLAATVYVWVTGFGGGDKTLSLDLDQTGGTSGTNAIFRVTSASSKLGWGDLTFKIVGTAVDNVYLGQTGTTPVSGAVSAGQYIIVADTDCADGEEVDIIIENSIVCTETLDY